MTKWIGVDFDGTLTKTVDWDGHDDGRIGETIWPMVDRVKQWLDEGREVRIVTARVARGFDYDASHWCAVQDWCVETFGKPLPITSEKDPNMLVLWDDRAVQLVRNTGKTPEEMGRAQYTRLPPLD